MSFGKLSSSHSPPPRHIAPRSALMAIAVLATVLGVGLAFWSYAQQAGLDGSAAGNGTAPASLGVPRETVFDDVTSAANVDFKHHNDATGQLLLPEIMGAGGALFDYDNDGDLDLFVVESGALTRSGTVKSVATSTIPDTPRSRLYRNDLEIRSDGSRALRFTDVTALSGIRTRGYGMGAATGDFINDGCVDLYVTNVGPNQLFRNNCDGTFTDVSAQSGTDDPRWSTSATFFDYDADGWLDLYVADYVDFSIEQKRECFSRSGAGDYCNPAVYAPVPDRLFHNNRDGTFTDVSVRSGIARGLGAGLGVVATDANGDGWLDLYVANDGHPNHLWMNEHGSGVFRDASLGAGVALSRSGQAQGSMGVDAADIDGDGDEDLFVTNLDYESSTFYRNLGGGLFDDRTIEAGLLAPSRGFTGFGARFFDYDNDGDLDLIGVNGSVVLMGNQQMQHNQLFRNAGGGTFVDVSDTAGSAFALHDVSRGVSVGDLDNDGDPDVVVFNNNGPLRILQNTVGQRFHWLGVRVIDAASRRDAIGARVQLVRRNGDSSWRRVHTDGSYLSASDVRVLFGLGADASRATVRVYWPHGAVEEFPNLAPDRYWVLTHGKPPQGS